jgi:hypothetical protein
LLHPSPRFFERPRGCCNESRIHCVGAGTGGPRDDRQAIDIHHHFMPPQYMKEEHERSNFGHAVSADQLLAWTPAQSLEIMD